MFKFNFVKFTCGSVLGGALAVVGHAYAAPGYTGGCLISTISADTSATRLTLQCSDGTAAYVAGPGYTGTGCFTQNTEQVKLWHAQAMASMLSGKKNNIWWADCNGNRSISGFQMLAQ
jgi:hypothetical protein